MRKLSLKGILIICLISLVHVFYISAQDISSADVQFDLEAYDLAIEGYLEHLENNPADEAAMYNLALAYKRTNQLVRSARWFEKLFLITADRPDEQKIAFGKVLWSLGLIDHAKDLFVACKEPDQLWVADQLINGCEQAKYLLQQDDPYQIFQFRPNSENADFSPVIWNDQLVYASFSDDDMENADLELDLFHSPANNLFLAPLDRKSGSNEVRTFGTSLSDKSGMVSCNFSKDGNKVLYTRNKFRNNNRHLIGYEKGMSVYLADVDENGDFFNDYAMPFNSTSYSVAFACFGMDESEIYFASNSHGEHTDFDIYKSTFNGVEWGEPVNLGPRINTQGNEVTPFYRNGILYFASDLIPGIGGYDLFKTQIDGLSIGIVENLGKGINSLEDDLYLVTDSNDNYYFTSNRIGGRGNYDIYIGIDDPNYNADNLMLAVAEDSGDEVPKAVSLLDLAEKNTVPIDASNAKIAGYNDNIVNDENVSLEGAVMVSYGEVLKSSSRVFFIQLASLSSTKGNVNIYRELVEFGNVYRVRKNNSYKIRLGYFHGQAEAKSILAQIKNEGFKDAFLVEDVLDTRELELLLSSFTFNDNQRYETPASQSTYKVRLAAYTNPLYFDTEKVKDLGVIEQWSKGSWTIFILSGYKNLDAAKSARIKAINRGFSGAELVKDDDGVLSRVKMN